MAADSRTLNIRVQRFLARQIDHLRTDLRFALRSLLRSPGFAVTAIVALALGIGLSTAVFTVANALLLRPLPVRDQERIVALWGETTDGRFGDVPLGYTAARAFARSTRTLASVAFVAYEGAWPVPIVDGGRLTPLRRAFVSGNYFDVLGARPLLGRALKPSDDVVGAASVVVLSYSGWQNAFGGTANIIGRRIQSQFDGGWYTIVGVMPQGLEYPSGTDCWAAVVPGRTVIPGDSVIADVNVIGRLRLGAPDEDARNEMTAFFHTMTGGVLLGPPIRGVATTLPRVILGDIRPALFVFLAAAVLLLVISCVNVGNLLLVRGLARRRELAMRATLGAGPGRIVAQQLGESALLAGLGSACGIALASAAVKLFVHFAPDATPRLGEIGVDVAALVGAIVIGGGALLLFGVGPALAASRPKLVDVLASGSRYTAPRRSRIIARALVASQIALAVVIVVVAGLLANSYARLARAPLGFTSSHLVIAEPSLRFDIYKDAGAQRRVVDRILESLRGVPGIASAAPVVAIPFSGNGGWDGNFSAEEQTQQQARSNPMFNMEVVTPEYFTTLGLRIARGRSFTAMDDSTSTPAVILNETAARILWPGGSAIGRRVRVMNHRLATVVGIVPDTRYRDLREPRPSIYFALRQSLFPYVPLTFAIRTVLDPSAVMPELRRVFSAAAPGVALQRASTFTTLLDGPRALPRLNTLLLAIFAGAALALAAFGLYAVIAAAVRQRMHELGVRLALGATPATLQHDVLREAFIVALAGVGVGLVGALGVSRLVRSLVFEVSPSDPMTLMLVALLLIGVSLIAAYAPARRAARIDPVDVLRVD